MTISIHAPREGGDGRHTANPTFGTKDFNPRPPRGGRRWIALPPVEKEDISIHAPREGGDQLCELLGCTEEISIHAPREGGDKQKELKSAAKAISIHAPREGGDAGADAGGGGAV